MPFSLNKPGAGTSGLRLADHVGDLVVFIGVTLETDLDTQFGKTNAARVQIAVPLDGESAGEVFHDSLIFGKAVVPMLVNSEGDSDIVVGRVGLGEVKKAGQNAPYVLQGATEDEEAKTVKWLEANIEQDADGKYSIKEASF